MAKSKTTFSKREKEKDRLRKRQEKEEKKQERKANARNGNNLDEIIAYVDEHGHVTNTPPDPKKFKKVEAADIVIGVQKQVDDYEVEPIRNGTVIMFNPAKGFGFIKDEKTGDEIFVHSNEASFLIKQNDKVSFKVEETHRGKNAVEVSKI